MADDEKSFDMGGGRQRLFNSRDTARISGRIATGSSAAPEATGATVVVTLIGTFVVVSALSAVAPAGLRADPAAEPTTAH